MQSKSLSRLAVRALEDLKATDITTLDVRELTDITDYMVVASGRSARQVVALAENVILKAKEADHRPLGVEGLKEGEWVLVDLCDVVVHVMQPATRELYLLEKLWGSDAVVCLYCDEPARDLLAHLRRAVRGPGPGQAVLGAYRPSLLWMLLAHDAPARVRELLNGVVAVLVEAPDAPWQLFVPERSVAALDRAGLILREEG